MMEILILTIILIVFGFLDCITTYFALKGSTTNREYNPITRFLLSKFSPLETSFG